MTDTASRVRRLGDGAARLATAFVAFVLAVQLAVGPIIWALGALMGNEVSFDGGPVRLLGQVVLAWMLARVAARRAEGSPVFGPRRAD